jgi:hypothetical protein
MALTFFETSGIERCEILTARSAGSVWSRRCRVSAWLENHCGSKEAGRYIFSLRDRSPGKANDGAAPENLLTALSARSKNQRYSGR